MSMNPFFDSFSRCPYGPDDRYFISHLTPRPVSQTAPAGWTPMRRLWPTKMITPVGDGSVRFDKHKFQANLDVQQFKPDDIIVKLSDGNMVTVEGKHEEQQDEHGYISRHFIRKFALPKTCDASQLQSKLSSDGVLTITAPIVEKGLQYKEIPIQQTGQPLMRVQEKKAENNEP